MSNIDTIGYAKAGKIFTASNVSAKILTVVGTAMTGLVVYNPIGSNKMLSFMTAGFTWGTISPSAQAIGIAIAPVSLIVPSSLTVGSAVIKSSTGGTAGSVAQTWDTATLGVACVTQRWFGGSNWITGGAGTFPYVMVDKIDGELGLMPGAAMAFSMIGGTGPTGMASISFVEIDI